MSTFVKKVTSAVAGLAIVSSIVTPLAGVSAAYTSLEAANELATLGVIVDNSANPADYELGNSIIRGEGVKVMMNLSDIAVVDNCDGNFSDLTASNWVCKYAETALANGMVADNANFRPNDLVSMIEGLKMVFQARELERDDNADWRAGYVSAAVDMGIATPFTNYDDAVTRGQMFIWAAEAIDAGEDVAVEDDLLCGILGTCAMDDEEAMEEEAMEEEAETPVVTTGSAMISLSPQSPSNGLAAVNTPRVAMLAFDVTAGASDVTLEQVTLFHVGLGDRANVDNVTIYNSANENVSKTKSFSDNDLDISFDRDIVVEAGMTETFTVTATLNDNGSTNTTYQIELAALEASASVSGAGIIGAALTPTVVANSAKLSVEDDTASDDITIGEEVTLAGFSIEETEDNEDVLIRTITLHQNGSIDADYLEDLVLEADGVVIATGMMVNNNDELVMNVDYVLAADDEVEFELMGTVSGDVNETVHFEFEEIDDIYATGISTGFNIGFNVGDEPQLADVASIETVEGAEIDAVFDKSDVDETKVDVDDVLVGTLELTANSNDYEVTEIEVTVTGTAGTAAIDDMYLGGQSFDSVSGNVYTFEDITLSQGVTEVLALEFDVNDSLILNGQDVVFAIKITEIEDDENNITYTDGGTNDVNVVLSTNAFDTQSIDIETASFELTQTSVNDRELVLANGTETVLYKAKISVGDSDDVTIEDLDLTLKSTSTLSVDLDDVIDSATLNIGGTTYDADIDSNSVDFTSVNHVVAAGSDNVELLITAVLQDDDSIGVLETVTMELLAANLDLEDSDNETVTNVTLPSNPSSKDTTTTLREEGTFSVKVINEVDTDDNLENTVLAGNAGVVLAELEVEAEYEDMDVETLEFTIPGDFSDTFNDVMIVNGSATVADGAIVTSDGTTTTIRFEDFTVMDSDDLIEGELVADLSTFTGQGDETSAQLGDVAVSLNVATIDVDGADSNNTITATTTGTVTGETVTVVPAMLTLSVPVSLSTGTANVRIDVDAGGNTVGTSNEDPEVVVTALTFADLNSTNLYTVYKNGNAVGAGAAADADAGFAALSVADRQFENSETFVFAPVNNGAVSQTFTLVLSGVVATYNVVDTDGNTIATGLTTTLDNDLAVGTTTISK